MTTVNTGHGQQHTSQPTPQRTGERPAARRRRPAIVLVVAAVVMVLAGGFGFTVSDYLASGGLVDPDSPSTHANFLMENEFPAARPNVLVLVDAPDTVDADAARRVGERVATDLAGLDGMAAVRSYWSTGDPALRAADGRSALVVGASLVDADVMREQVDNIDTRVAQESPGYRVRLGGIGEVNRAITDQVNADLLRTELIALPLTLIALLFIFRGLTAAALPVCIGLFAVVLTMLVLRVVTVFAPVSNFSLNLCTALGLGLAIDYALLVVRRFREECAAGRSIDEAVAATVRGAGRTVLFSAVTVALALCALLVFPMYFLRSFAYAGITVVLATAVAAVVVLPAALTFVGARVAGAARHASGTARAQARSGGSDRWRRLALATMRRPLLVLLVACAGLLVLAGPVLDVRFGPTDHRQLPADTQASQVQEAVRTQFADLNGLNYVVLDGPGQQPAGTTAVAEYAGRLSGLTGVRRVDSVAGSYARGAQVAPPGETAEQFFVNGRYTWVAVWVDGEPTSAAAKATAQAVRTAAAPAPTLAGGATLEFRDTTAAIARGLPWAIAIISISTLVLLFLLTGSLLIPVKALLLNLLSLSVPFGAMVWIFQQNHLAGLLGGFQTTGYLDITIPVLAFCVAFGLSMDYEVFLLSRITEERRNGRDTADAVATGLQRTGGVVTAAALLISIVLIGLSASRIMDLKLLGVGLTLAIVIDATVIRCLLVPAIMRLMGEANWWAPGPLARLHRSIGIREH